MSLGVGGTERKICLIDGGSGGGMWVALSDKCHSCRTFGDLETKITNATAYKATL